jgi:LacI family transcriptional regulator
MAKEEATIYEVADRAGVSIATVSRVVNGTAVVRPDTRKRVEAAMKQLKYLPSSAARGLSGGRNFSIGLAYAMYEHHTNFNTAAEENDTVLFTDAIIRGASAQAAHLGYSLFTCSVNPTSRTGILPVQQLAGTIDGLILADRVMSASDAARFAKRMPLVMLTGLGDEHRGASVRTDNALAIRDIVEHLAKIHGVRRFGFLSGIPGAPDAEERRFAFSQSVRAVGGSAEACDELVGFFSLTLAEAAMERRLASGEPLPEAFVCANDQMALGIIHTLREHGIKVPQDILVTGFDDIPVARRSHPSLTTVRQSSFNLGVNAVSMVIGLLTGEVKQGTTLELPTELVARRSCGCNPTVPKKKGKRADEVEHDVAAAASSS